MGGGAEELRSLAVDLAEGAGDLLLGARPSGLSPKSSPTDLVTDADRAAEAFIVERIRRARPSDSIVAEEGSLHSGGSGVSWVIDPLDGTINFVYGIPHWCVSIGIEGAVRAGVIHDPNRRETFTDADDLVPSSKTELSTAMAGTGFSYSSETRAVQGEVVARVLPQVRDIRRGGSMALDLAWIACGRLDCFWEDDSRPWDISAGLAIIASAGGSARCHGAMVTAAGNQVLLDALEAVVLERRP